MEEVRQGAHTQGRGAALTALDELDEQAEALQNASKADKELASQLSDIGKAVAKQRKLSEQDAKAQAEAEDDEASPAQLTTRLIPLMREVRKGHPMHALIALSGPLAAVLLSRRLPQSLAARTGRRPPPPRRPAPRRASRPRPTRPPGPGRGGQADREGRAAGAC